MKANTSVPTKKPDNALNGPQKFSLRSFILNYNAIIFLVVLFVVAVIASPTFLTPQNLNTVLRQQTTYIIIAIGMLLVIITGGIDLAAAATVALSSILMATAVTSWGMGVFGAIAVGMLVGVAVGAFNGFLVAQMRMPAFIVTLAFSYIGRGIAFIITKGNTIMMDGTDVYRKLVYPGFASKAIPGINFPLMALVAVAAIVVFVLVMKYTKFGRLVYAVGSNESAVQLAGINSKRVLFLVYLLEGILCALAGVLLTCRTGNASALTADGDYSLSTIAAVVIGGASLAGGEGTVLMTVVGAFVIAIIGNIMNLVGMASYPQMVVKGAVIIFAVLMKGISSKKRL